ncbi:hypothetical protein AB205_0217540 [Aquarana catesbeiana]|uniref:Uncharacterized protein n=1 Tax=Aquarana catesbeiana TaxID=8400 RepID=A0A2G9SJ69_AQUCT|nr:hypothetical protein AB205_0217540 [Aquarana catesbeiana]
MRQQSSHQKGRREVTLSRAPTGEATRPSSLQKLSVVISPRMLVWRHGF